MVTAHYFLVKGYQVKIKGRTVIVKQMTSDGPNEATKQEIVRYLIDEGFMRPGMVKVSAV